MRAGELKAYKFGDFLYVRESEAIAELQRQRTELVRRMEIVCDTDGDEAFDDAFVTLLNDLRSGRIE